MTHDEQEKLNDLCKRIIAEEDPKVFDELVNAMNDLLEKKYDRINPQGAITLW